MGEKKEKKLNKDIQRMLEGMKTWEEERRKKAEVELWKRAEMNPAFVEAGRNIKTDVEENPKELHLNEIH